MSKPFKAGLELILGLYRKWMEKLFKRLSPWSLKLYVYEKDLIF
jgi:hypothetical protein